MRLDVKHSRGSTQGWLGETLATPQFLPDHPKIHTKENMQCWRYRCMLAILMQRLAPLSHQLLTPKNLGVLTVPLPTFPWMHTQTPHDSALW